MTELLLPLLVVLRFLCFIAVVYLVLHVLFSRLISKPDSKVLWFFSVLTRPLTWPIRAYLPDGTTESRLRFVGLVFYSTLWLVVLVVMEIVARTLS